MRKKFFLTIFLALALAASAVSVMQFVFFSRERLRLIDQQVDVVASSLLSSDLNETELDEMGDVIAEALESEPRTMLVTVYGPRGRIQYRNPNAQLIFGDEVLGTEAARDTVRRGEHSVRFLNLRVAPAGRTLQIGLLLDRGQVQWKTLNRSVVFYGASILLVILVAAALLTLLLLKPLSTLADHLRMMGASLGAGGSPGVLPVSLSKEIIRREKSWDEFARLISAVRELGQRLEGTFRLNRASAAQMAHEFKTPLTILRNSIEAMEMRIRGGDPRGIETLLKQAGDELEHLNRVISGFLDWSGTEHGLPTDVIDAVQLAPLVRSVAGRLASIYGDRLRLEFRCEPTVFGRRDLVEQAVRNLIDNALKYSPAEAPVEVVIGENRLLVSDAGPGIPEAVVARMGLPFNIGPDAKDAPSGSLARRPTGLGLAWVVTVSKMYGWTLRQRRDGDRTRVSLEFGASEKAG